MKKAILAIAGVALCLAACGHKEAPAEKELDPAKKVAPDKSGHADPGVQEDLDTITWLDDVTAGDEGDAGTALDNATSVGGKRLVVELTTEQREELERQREKNRGSGVADVTVVFTPEQLDAIRRVCPRCEEKSITWHTDRVGVRLTLYFDEAGRIVKPLEPVPYVSR
jgi:predicted small lipoprotein YifL